MINIPTALFKKYSLLLSEKSIPTSLHNNYKKWLRFYLDFCRKYCHPYAVKDSLNQFMIKLNEKNQSEDMQELLGHSDVRTTMIYRHCVPSKTLMEVKSPLDF